MSTLSADFEVRERQPRHLTVTAPPSLDDLAATANREHGACEAALQTALGHAIAAGEALVAARDVVGLDGWRAWLAENFKASAVCASYYIRFAVYRDLLDADTMTVGAAQIALRGLPDTAPKGRARYPEHMREEAKRLVRRESMTHAEVARRLGVTPHTVRSWVDPATHRRRTIEQKRRYRKAARALAAQEREQAIKAAVRKLPKGSALAESYSLNARLAKALAQAEREATTDEARAALADATAHYHRMSDAIVLALGVSS